MNRWDNIEMLIRQCEITYGKHNKYKNIKNEQLQIMIAIKYRRKKNGYLIRVDLLEIIQSDH